MNRDGESAHEVSTRLAHLSDIMEREREMRKRMKQWRRETFSDITVELFGMDDVRLRRLQQDEYLTERETHEMIYRMELQRDRKKRKRDKAKKKRNALRDRRRKAQ